MTRSHGDDRQGPPGGCPPTDEELARLAATDRAAFAALYRRWAEPVYRYCYRRLGSREAAEDATGHVMERALASIGRFRGDTFAAWLFAIAHNHVASTVRRPAYRLSAPLPDDLPLVDPAPGPESLAVAAETSGALWRALAVLTPEQREVVDLRLADLTTAEICAVTGRTADAVKMLHFRAVRRLRRELAEPPAGAGQRDRDHA